MGKRLAVPTIVFFLCFLLLAFPISAERGNVIQNGSFEDGFVNGVANHWGSFHNGGLADSNFHDDTWDPVVYDGEYSQLIEISTLAYGGSEPDRYAGVYQVVDVTPGARYDFLLYGMIRSTEGTEDDSEYGYRVEVGFNYDGGTDWQTVGDWTEMSWPEYPRLEPGAWKNHYATVYPTGDKLTVFIRAWKKFGTARQEGNINIDNVSLTGQIPSTTSEASTVEDKEPDTMPVTGVGLAIPVVGLACGAALLAARKLRT